MFNHYCALGGTALFTTYAKYVYMFISMWYSIKAEFGMKDLKNAFVGEILSVMTVFSF